MGYSDERHAWGKQKEVELMAIIQSFFDEPLTPTEEQTSRKDWVSDNWVVELKSRTDRYTSKSFTTWWVPVSKFINLGDKNLAVFYYWNADKTLWRLKYSADKLSEYSTGFPWDGFAVSKQLHYNIPATEFELVRIVP